MVIDTENVVYASYPTNEWIVDFETGQNKPPKSSIDAVSQDLKFALSVERYKFPIMGSNYGITLDEEILLRIKFYDIKRRSSSLYCLLRFFR